MKTWSLVGTTPDQTAVEDSTCWSHLQRGIYPAGISAHDGWQPPLPSGRGPVRQLWTGKRGGWWRPATWNWCARATITSDAHGAGWAQNRSISSSSSKCRRRKVTEKNIWATGVEAMLQPRQHHGFGLREVSIEDQERTSERSIEPHGFRGVGASKYDAPTLRGLRPNGRRVEVQVGGKYLLPVNSRVLLEVMAREGGI